MQSGGIGGHPGDGCFVGHIDGIRDVIGFHGESVAELRAAFEEAVDDYLATCKKLGQAPNKPYSGQFRLRLAPDRVRSFAPAFPFLIAIPY